MGNKTLKWLYKVPGKHRAWVILLSIMHVVLGAFGVLYALLLKAIVDHAVAGERTLFFRCCVFFLLLELGRIVLVSINRRCTELAKATLENRFKAYLFEKILYGDHARVTATHSGEWLNRLTNDVVVVSNGYVDILPGLLGMAVRMLSALIMILFIDKWIAIVMIPIGLVLSFLTYLIRKRLKKMHKAIQETDGKLRIFMQESIESLMIIKSFGAEERTIADGEAKMGEHKKARMRRNTYSVLANVGYLLTMNGMYILGICYGGYGILAGTLSYGSLMAVSQLITQLQGPIVNITGLIPKVFTMSASAERLMEIEEYEVDGAGKSIGRETDGEKSDRKTSAAHNRAKAAELYSSLECLGMRDIDFTYYAPATEDGEMSKENMMQVLSGFSLEVRKGEFVAFSGPSGCGKSTVLKLLMCLYQPDQGALYLKSAGTERTLTAAERPLFAYVPQGNYLMSGTVREIVSFSDPDAADDTARIQKALKISCASAFVDEKELGVDSVLGERGSGLSEGQMQRIAIARAVFSERPVLLLDEATSGLDEETEKQLLSNLRTMTDKTVIIVTHRRAVMEACDRVVEF